MGGGGGGELDGVSRRALLHHLLTQFLGSYVLSLCLSDREHPHQELNPSSPLKYPLNVSVLLAKIGVLTFGSSVCFMADIKRTYLDG